MRIKPSTVVIHEIQPCPIGELIPPIYARQYEMTQNPLAACHEDVQVVASNKPPKKDKKHMPIEGFMSPVQRLEDHPPAIQHGKIPNGYPFPENSWIFFRPVARPKV